MRTFAGVAVGFLAMACAGHLETRPLNQTTWRVDSTKPALEGVVYYAPQYMKITYRFSEFVDKDGKKVGSADENKCEKVIQKEEIQILPNYDKAYVVRQTAGFLAANKLGVTLANGMLTGVNVESATKAPELTTALASLAKEIAAVAALGAVPAAGAKPACNAGPRITDFGPYTPGH